MTHQPSFLRRQHSTGLDTRLPVLIKKCQYDGSQKKQTFTLQERPTPNRGIQAERNMHNCVLRTVMKKVPGVFVYCVCQMTFNMVTRII